MEQREQDLIRENTALRIELAEVYMAQRRWEGHAHTLKRYLDPYLAITTDIEVIPTLRFTPT